MATNWTLDGYRMKVNGQPFFAKGVSYSPVPWGSCPSFLPFGDFTIDTWKSIWTRDLPLMRNNSVNLLKTYNTLDAAQLKQGGFPITWDHSHKGFLDACWNGGDKPIYVLMGYAPPKNDMHIFYQEDWSKPANVAARAAMQTNLVTLATDYGGTRRRDGISGWPTKSMPTMFAATRLSGPTGMGLPTLLQLLLRAN